MWDASGDVRKNPSQWLIFVVPHRGARSPFCTRADVGYSTVHSALLETVAEPRRHSFAALWPDR